MPARITAPTRRDLALAIGFFLAGCLLHAIGGASLGGVDQTAAVGWQVTLLATACLALLWRSAYPLSALGVGIAVAVLDALVTPGGLLPSLPVLLVLGDLIHAVVLHSSRRAGHHLLRVLTITVVLLTAAAVWNTHDIRLAVIVPLIAAALFFTPVWWARDVRHQQEITQIERQRAEQTARVADLDRRAAIAAERAAMARDLHDVIANHLSAIAMQSSAALSAETTDETRTHTVLTSVRHNSVQALTEMRAMIGLLRSDGADYDQHHDAPTTAARLRELDTVLETARANGLHVHAHGAQDLPDLPAAVDLTAYRVVQEALANAARHAPGSEVVVTLAATPTEVTVEVVNEMTGPPQPGAGVGLASMRERTEAVRGSLQAGSCARGWRVHARLPLEGSGS